MIYLVKEDFQQQIVILKIVISTSDGESIQTTLIIWHFLSMLISHEGGQQLEYQLIGEWWALHVIVVIWVICLISRVHNNKKGGSVSNFNALAERTA